MLLRRDAPPAAPLEERQAQARAQRPRGHRVARRAAQRQALLPRRRRTGRSATDGRDDHLARVLVEHLGADLREARGRQRLCAAQQHAERPRADGAVLGLPPQREEPCRALLLAGCLEQQRRARGEVDRQPVARPHEPLHERRQVRPLAVVSRVVGGGKRDLRLVQIVGRLGGVPGGVGVAQPCAAQQTEVAAARREEVPGCAQVVIVVV